MDLEKFYKDAVAAATEKAELTLKAAGYTPDGPNWDAVTSGIGIGASEVLIRLRKLVNGEQL